MKFKRDTGEVSAENTLSRYTVPFSLRSLHISFDLNIDLVKYYTQSKSERSTAQCKVDVSFVAKCLPQT